MKRKIQEREIVMDGMETTGGRLRGCISHVLPERNYGNISITEGNPNRWDFWFHRSSFRKPIPKTLEGLVGVTVEFFPAPISEAAKEMGKRPRALGIVVIG